MANENTNPFNEFILVPEFIIQKVLKQALFFLNFDYNKQIEDYNDETLSYLYILTYGLGIERLNLFKQAKNLFINVPDEKQKIKIFLGFPQVLEGAVSVAIVNSGEQPGIATLGVGEATEDYHHEYNYTEDTPEEETENSNVWRKVFSKRYNASYQIIITGANTNETVIVYTIIKSLLISLEGTSHLSVFGFQNCKISSNDVTIKNETTKSMYAKSITLSFEYDYKVPDMIKQTYVNGLIFQGVIADI